MQWLIFRLAALCLGFCLDLLLGDPRWMPHPVRGMGHMIDAFEKLLRKIFPKTKSGELTAGVFLVTLTAGICTGLTILLRLLLGHISQWLVFAVDIILCYQLLATKALRHESMKVYEALRDKNISAARFAVSMIVGRDTDKLGETGIIKAAVETVAENASDGVIAPLIFLALGGTPLGVFYKACNTMDSMVGYKNKKYLYFGRAAALFDDFLNFIPARVSGLLMCPAAYLSGLDGQGAFRIFFRDRLKHKSPNAAHTEAACAGALGIELAGSGYYFGRLTHKPVIGDPVREIEIEDIPRSNRLMYTASILALIFFCVIPALVIAIFILD